jgi:hypothetical protein
MKRLLLVLLVGVSAPAWSQTEAGLPKGPINNQWVVSTPGLDTLWIQTVPVPDLEPFRRLHCVGIATGMLEERP